mgnify:CR=1 FL=1
MQTTGITVQREESPAGIPVITIYNGITNRGSSSQTIERAYDKFTEAINAITEE